MDRATRKLKSDQTAQRKGKCLDAYTHWVANPYLRLVDVATKFGIGDDSLRYYLKANGHKRPDNGEQRLPAGQSDRQVRIRETYEKAMKQGKDANWAVNFANEGTGKRSINKGDFVYYAVKNDLPEIPDPNKKTTMAIVPYSR